MDKPSRPHQGHGLKLAPLGLLLLIAIAVMLFVPPIAQDTKYHHFADQRTLWNIPHALNVLSNIPFVIFGLAGLAWLMTPEGRMPGKHYLFAWGWWAYLLLFACMALTGLAPPIIMPIPTMPRFTGTDCL